jgi:hypothetical protein
LHAASAYFCDNSSKKYQNKGKGKINFRININKLGINEREIRSKVERKHGLLTIIIIFARNDWLTAEDEYTTFVRWRNY